MLCNFKRAVSLTLLAGVVNVVFATLAPVSAIGSETDVQQLKRLLDNRARVQLQMQQQIDDMAAEISELRGTIEKNSYDMQQMLERQRQLFIELDKVRNQSPQSASLETATNTSGVTTSGGVFSSNEKERVAYENAVRIVRAEKNFPKALAAFQEFQQNYPDSVYTANAHYWTGQLHFVQKNDVEAAKSFASVVAYQDSPKRADSLMKLGDIAARNRKPNVAKKYYQQVVDEYPNSSSSEMAKSKLK